MFFFIDVPTTFLEMVNVLNMWELEILTFSHSLKCHQTRSLWRSLTALMTLYCSNLQEHSILKSDAPVLLKLSAFYILLSWQRDIEVLKVCRPVLQFRWGERSEEVAACMFFCPSPLLHPSFAGRVLRLVWSRRRQRGWEQVSIWLAEWTSLWLCDYRLITLQWVAANGFFVKGFGTLLV